MFCLILGYVILYLFIALIFNIIVTFINLNYFSKNPITFKTNNKIKRLVYWIAKPFDSSQWDFEDFWLMSCLWPIAIPILICVGIWLLISILLMK